MRIAVSILAAVLAACGGGGGGSASSSPPPVNDVVTPIYDVQGSGAASPFNGQIVTVQGVVTGDFQDGDADATRDLGGFYIQHLPDGDFETSDGIFIFDGGNPAADVSPGDSVSVTGTVNEHFGETQIAADAVTVLGTGTLLPFPVSLPAATTTTNSDGRLIADLERYEGMLIRLPQTLTVAKLWELESYGTVLLTEGGRQHQFTDRNSPDIAGFRAHNETIASRRLLLDDGRRVANVAPITYLNAGLAPGYSLRVGDQVTGLVGNLRFSRGSGASGIEDYRLMPTEEPRFEPMNPRPGPPSVAGSLRIASFNIHRLFSTIDSGQRICGPAADGDCLGADSPQELQRQLAKIVVALAQIDADIVGLIELENNADGSLQLLVDALNAELGAGTYALVETGTIGSGVIKNGLIFKPAMVSPVGAPAILDSSVDAQFNDLRNRPVVAQTFVQNTDAATVTVAVNHLKSKGSPCDSAGDPDIGDGQANCNVTRTDAATAMANWLATDPTGSGDTDVLIIGDINAHTFEDPVSALRSAGYVNLGETMIGLDAYTFVFDGQVGALDQVLASPSLAPQIRGITDWHINADEPAVLDYNLENNRDPALYDATSPYRSSDHDPLVIGLDLSP